MYYLTHKTGKIRLMLKKDGTYVLQEQWVNENAISKDGKFKHWWKDMPTVKEIDEVEDTEVYMTEEEYIHQGEVFVIDSKNGDMTCGHWEKKQV